MPERRNPVVRAGAILRKGGVHTKSASGQRHRQRLRIDDAIDEWFEDVNEMENTPVDTDSQHLGNQSRSQEKNIGKHRKSNPTKGQPKAAPSDFCLVHFLSLPFCPSTISINTHFSK